MPKGKFFCFSPPVMLATFIFEIGAAIYILWRYRIGRTTRLVILILLLLATFQFAEYMVCERFGLNSVQWARVGYAAITLLPPLGLHLVQRLGGSKARWPAYSGYVVALPFLIFFLFAHSPFGGQECLGNYVIFQIPRWVSWGYAAYYYGLLAIAVWYAWRFAARTTSTKQRVAMHTFAVGYMAFIIPTAAVAMLQPDTLRGIPSIMCGFAVLLAVALTFGVVPLIDKVKRKRDNTD